MGSISKVLVCMTRKCLPFLSQPHRCVLSKAAKFESKSLTVLKIPEPQLDLERFCDPKLTEHFSNNCIRRKGVGNIKRVIELNNELKKKRNEILKRELIQEALQIPNDTHPQPSTYQDDAEILKFIGKMPEFNSFKPKPFDQLVEKTDQYRMEGLANFAGHKSYYLSRELAALEQALARFTIERLLEKGFSLISVPDILHHQIIESCGVPTRGQRSLVYHLDADKHLASAAEGALCLSGTSEMALAGFLMNRTFLDKALPMKLVAVSRCYRAETSQVASEKGLYRVHQFTKVEMFSVSTEDQSDNLLEEFRSIQEEIFSSFGLYLRVLDMPPHELGAQAYRKYDIEAWFSARSGFGEISSCSNCTDYQSRRLNIKYRCENSDQKRFAHTVNGTACAIPRLVMAICEANQQIDESIKIPKILRPYMLQKDIIRPVNRVTKFHKGSKTFKEFVNDKDDLSCSIS